MTIPIANRRVSFGPPISHDFSSRRVTMDARRPTKDELEIPGMQEVARYPASTPQGARAYTLMTDTGTGEWVLFAFPAGPAGTANPPPTPRPTARLPEEPGDTGMPPRSGGAYGNPDGGATEPLSGIAMAVPRELRQTEADWKKATGIQDAELRAFDARVHRLLTGVRTRSLNDANRRHYGQPPVGGDGPKAA